MGPLETVRPYRIRHKQSVRETVIRIWLVLLCLSDAGLNFPSDGSNHIGGRQNVLRLRFCEARCELAGEGIWLDISITRTLARSSDALQFKCRIDFCGLSTLKRDL